MGRSWNRNSHGEPLHVLFLSDNFPPEVNAPASRTYEHCREWVKAGHRVTVVTCVPNFPTGRVFDGYRNRPFQWGTISGIRVLRVWSYLAANEGFLRRTLDYASYMASATVASPFVRDVDVVVATSPQFFTACAGYATARLMGKPFVFELRDLWPESIRAVGAMQDGRMLRLLERLELFLYRQSAAVVSVTQTLAGNLLARGIDGGKIHVVTNGVDVGRFAPAGKDEDLAAAHGLSGRFVAGYVGTHGMAHGLDTVLDAAEKLRADPDGGDVAFLMLGDGAEKNNLVARAKQRGLDNVVFVDTVAKAEVARYWSLLDAAIVHLKKADLFAGVIPSKLFEAMAMGLPVLHGVEGESAEIVSENQAGLLFEPENAGALADSVMRLSRDRVLRDELGRNGARAVLKYGRPELAAQMLGVLESVSSAGTRH